MSESPIRETGPMAERVIRPRTGLIGLNFEELWRYRELFVFLAWRDILIRYKQTALGVFWAILQPVLTTIIFTVVFSRFAKLSSNGVPYSLVIFSALLPWQFFSNTLSESSASLVVSSNLISKVYFPRLIIPGSAVLSGLADFVISFIIMVVMMVYNHTPLQPQIIYLPGFFLIAFLSAFAAGIWLSALNVKYRDVKYIVPFFTRMGLYISPVGFLSTVVPEQWRFLYSLNPMVGAIDGFRWCILGNSFAPNWPGLWTSLSITLVVLAGGLIYFRNTEKTFADVI